MDDDSLFEANKLSFRNIFYKHLTERDSPCISYKKFFKFCCTLKIYPELISSFDIKRILSLILKKKVNEEKPPEISYSSFMKSLALISEHCFPSGDSMKLLITYIKNMCQSLYQVTLSTSLSLVPVTRELIRKSKSNFKLLTTRRLKNSSSNGKKVLNKSISQKLSLSGLMTPKNNTVTYKNAFDFKTPSLKLLSSRNRRESKSKLMRIGEIFEKFKQTQQTGEKKKSKNGIMMKFIGKFVEDKKRSVIPI